MVNIDFVSILLFLGMGQCVFLIGSTLFSRQRGHTANLLLMALLFAFLWFQLEFFLIRHTLDTQIPFIYSTRYGAWLIIGPLILLYNRTSIIKDYLLKKKDFLHFLPFLLFTILLPLLLKDIITNRSTDYGMLTVFDNFNREQITVRHYFYAFIFVFQFVHALIYIFIAYRETNNYLQLAKQLQSSIPDNKVNTLRYLYITAIVIILLCSGFVIYQFSTSLWQRNLDYLYVLPTLIFVFGLAYRAMRYPNSVLLLEADEKKEKYARSSLADSAKSGYLKLLEQQLEKEMIYRNNELRLSDLAKELDMSTHHLSQLINEEKQQNFFDFINSYRIREAKEKIANDKSRTLLDIAFEVGFNNKNSFNSAFKKHVGMTPSMYRKTN